MARPVPAIAVARNDDPGPRVASVKTAANGSHPERLSLQVHPAPFSWEAYQKAPQAYIDVVEPARVFQPAPEEARAPGLQFIGQDSATVQSGQRITLSVQTDPRAPVSWASPEGGAFAESSLAAVTVQANDAGVAHATWIATPGTVNYATVLVASPARTATLTFRLFVPEAH